MFVYLQRNELKFVNMTATNMKQSSMNLINQIDDNDTALLEKVWLFLTSNVPTKKSGMTADQKRRVALVEELCGAFSACQTVDWKQDKEEYLLEKYGK